MTLNGRIHSNVGYPRLTVTALLGFHSSVQLDDKLSKIPLLVHADPRGLAAWDQQCSEEEAMSTSSWVTVCEYNKS